jgi:hypothetical protein
VRGFGRKRHARSGSSDCPGFAGGLRNLPGRTRTLPRDLTKCRVPAPPLSMVWTKRVRERGASQLLIGPASHNHPNGRSISWMNSSLGVDNLATPVDRRRRRVDDGPPNVGESAGTVGRAWTPGRGEITRCSVWYVLQTTTSCGLGLTGDPASRIVFESRSSAGGTEFGLPGPAEGSSMTGMRAAPIDRSGAQAGEATDGTA